jgi:hypothetical protein
LTGLDAEELRQALDQCNAKAKKIDDVCTDATNFYLSLLVKKKTLNISGVVNKIILGEKTAVEFYLPGLLITRGASLETLGLTTLDATDHQVTAQDKDGKVFVLKLGMKVDLMLVPGKQHWMIVLSK